MWLALACDLPGLAAPGLGCNVAFCTWHMSPAGLASQRPPLWTQHFVSGVSTDQGAYHCIQNKKTNSWQGKACYHKTFLCFSIAHMVTHKLLS